MKTTIKHCQHCKGTVDLVSNGINKYKGKVYEKFMCTKCNTERVKAYRKTPKGRANINKAVYKSIEKLSYKQDARIILNNAFHKGILTKPMHCEKCKNEGRVEGHHQDYFRPLDVMWLCKKCHSALHHEVRTK